MNYKPTYAPKLLSLSKKPSPPKHLAQQPSVQVWKFEPFTSFCLHV
jgi:hypothetical protein